MTVEIPVGSETIAVRLRSMTAGDLSYIQRTFTVEHQAAAAIATCVVNDEGMQTHTVDHEGISYIHGIDSKIFDALTDAINAFCLNQKTVPELVKNYE